MRIAVVGAGCVGMVQAACMCDFKHQVALVENDPERYRMLTIEGRSPVEEPGINERLKRYLGSQLTVSRDIREVADASIVFVCVGTPAKTDGTCDLSQLWTVVSDIAELVHNNVRTSTIVVIKSTVPLGTCQSIRSLMLRRGRTCSSFLIAYNPEFLREGFGIHDFTHPERVVIGVTAEEVSRARPLLDLYKACLPEAKVLAITLEAAELVKLAANSFLALKISFANLISDVCERFGADAADVLPAIGADSRIGGLFLNPGIGFGGGCLPKDVEIFINDLTANGISAHLLHATKVINDQRPRHFVDRVLETLGSLHGKRIAVWGLAYKGHTNDVRSSPAISVVNWLLSEGATVVAYDPLRLPDFHASKLTLLSNPISALENADALCILTDTVVFRDLLRNDACRTLMHSPIVFDGRNICDVAEMTTRGYIYISTGRPIELGAFATTLATNGV